jgi:hypothetical protein
MKFGLLLLSALISFSAFADYKSELKEIEKFEVDEYLNKKNYPPFKPGEVPAINKAFYDKLMAEPTSLKYFMVLKTCYRTIALYKRDKAFQLSLESKFGGKKLTKDDWEKVFEFLANPIMAESNTEHKKMLSNRVNSDAHFEKHFSRLMTASFK